MNLTPARTRQRQAAGGESGHAGTASPADVARLLITGVSEDQDMAMLTERAQDLLDRPIQEWQLAVASLSTELRQSIESDIAALTIKAARLSAYLTVCTLGGGHEQAVKRQNQVARKVRRAMGYTYADDAITF